MNVRMKVLIVDDDILFRQRLGRLFEASEEIEIVGEATNGEEVISKIWETSPNIILMDIKTPQMDASDSVRFIKESCPGLSIIAVSTNGDIECLLKAINAGAAGYMKKDVSADTLVSTITQVHRRNKPLVHLTAEQAEVEAMRDK